MSDELEGKQPEAGSVTDKPVEGTAPEGAGYDGPIEKFKGKTAAEIAQTYAELESAYGKRDAEFKAAGEELTSYKQYYANQQQQQRQPAPVAQPTAPADIYDNPGAFVDQRTQPIVNKAVEAANFRNALNIAPMVMESAKNSYPKIFEGVDEGKLKAIMLGGVNSGSINYTALTDPSAWKMAAWQMKGEETGYKPTNAPPMSTTQTESPAGGSSEGEPAPMPREAKEWAMAMGKDPKKAQEIWNASVKKEEK